MKKSEIVEFVKSPYVAKFMRVALPELSSRYEAISDFERFSVICENMDAILESGVRRDFLAVLEKALGKISLDALSVRDVQKAVWRALNNGEANVDFYAFCHSKTAKKTSDEIYRFSESHKCINIKEYLTSNVCNLPSTITNLVGTLSNSMKVDLSLDLQDFSFSRPDEYHANITYQQMVSGEKCNNNDMSALTAHMMCETAKNVDCVFYIVVHNNYEIYQAELLTEFFIKRNTPLDLRICFESKDFSLASKIFDFLCDKEKNISSEIIISEEISNETIKNHLCNILEYIPYSRIRFCKMLSCAKDEDVFLKAITELYLEKT